MVARHDLVGRHCLRRRGRITGTGLDGEVAVYDQQLRSRFEWLREPDSAAVASPPVLMVLDLLSGSRRMGIRRSRTFGASRISDSKAKRLATKSRQTYAALSAAAINRPLALLRHPLHLAREKWGARYR